MTNSATAIIEIETLGAGEKRITLDCRHGTSVVHAVNAGAVEVGVLIAVAAAKHFAVEGCACTE